LKKKTKQNITIGIVAASIVAVVIVVNYSADQAKIRGFNFGNNLLEINNEVKNIQDDFFSKIIQWEEGNITKEELAKFADAHILQFEEQIKKYEALDTPTVFVKSVELFKRSVLSQIESDKEFMKWVETGDKSYRVRSDSLIQEAFEYENAALADFNAAKMGK